MNYTIDLGQVIISILLTSVAVIGYLIKEEVSNFKKQIDRHESLIIGLLGDVQRLIGFQEGKSNK